MPSLNYEEIYSKFRLKAEAYDILQYREDDVSAVFMPEYLHSSINKPYIRRLFSELKLGDTVQELTYTMKYEVQRSMGVGTQIGRYFGVWTLA